MAFNSQSFSRFCAAIYERFSCGVVVLDVAGRPLFINEAAAEIMSEHPILHLDRAGSLHSRCSALNEIIGKHGTNPAREPAVEVVRVDLEDSGVIAVWIIPLTDYFGASAPNDDSAPHLILKLIRNEPNVVSSQLLSRVLQISRAEGRLVQQLLKGNNLKQYAMTTNISYNTVRNQLRSVMSKTGARSQTELVAMAHRLIAPLAYVRDEELTVHQR